MSKIWSKEQWKAARAMVEEEGECLRGASRRSGIPYSTLNWKARVECWAGPGGLKRGRPRDTKILQVQAKRIEAAFEREEVLLKAEASLVKAEDLEIMARKSLAADSARTKLAVSRLIAQTLQELGEPSVKPENRAKALASLAVAIKLVHKWHEEPDIAGMEQARGAINLALIATTPEQLRALGDPNRDSREGVSVKGERNGLSMGPSVEEPEQATAFPPVSQPKQEASSSPVEEPAPSSRTLTQERVAPPIAPRQPVQGSPPCSPAAQEREAFERARDEHRKDLRERQKYR